jgi:hypothetical protein
VRRPSPTSAKRWTLKLALCLLAGAMVAWGCALKVLSISARSRLLYKLDDGRWTHWLMGRALGNGTVEWRVIDTKRAEHILRYAPESFLVVSNPPAEVLGLDWARYPGTQIWTLGWPLSSHWATAVPPWMASDAGPWWLLSSINAAGFALNSVLFGAMMLGGLEGLAFVRSGRDHRRRRKGRCPSCGYDRAGLAESAACPECGGKE